MKHLSQYSLSKKLEPAIVPAIAPATTQYPKRWQQVAFGAVFFLTVHLAVSNISWMAPLIHAFVHLATVIYYSCALLRKPPSFLTPRSKRGFLLGSCLITIALLASMFCLPASAQFYGAAEGFFQSSFPQAATAIPLLFNALRGIFIIYVGIALISVLRAFQQGEDWLSVARSPAVVVVVVALGDVLTSIIIG